MPTEQFWVSLANMFLINKYSLVPGNHFDWSDEHQVYVLLIYSPKSHFAIFYALLLNSDITFEIRPVQ